MKTQQNDSTIIYEEIDETDDQGFATEIILVTNDSHNNFVPGINFEADHSSETYLCGCGQDFETFLDLFKHESEVHSTEFKSILTELKNVIIEFMKNQRAMESSVVKEVSCYEPTFSLKSIKVVSQEDTDDTAILNRLKGLGGIKLKPVNRISSFLDSKPNNEPLITLKRVSDYTPRTPPPKRYEIIPVHLPTPLPKPNRPEYHCNSCNISFNASHLMNTHQREFHPYVCEICGTKYNYKNNLELHMLKIHLGIPTHCEKCSRNFVNLEEHKKTHDADPEFVCDYCGVTVVGKPELSRHIRQRHKESIKFHVCHVCNKKFGKKYELMRHQVLHDPNPEQHSCPICQKTFIWKNCMWRHLKSHTQNFPCSFCSKVYARSDGLKNHVKKHHAGTEPVGELNILVE